MLKINRIITCIFILTFVLSVLSACSSTGSNESSKILEDSKSSTEVVTNTYSNDESISSSTTDSSSSLQSDITSTSSDITEITTSKSTSKITTTSKATTTSTTTKATTTTTKKTTTSSEFKTEPPKTDPPKTDPPKTDPPKTDPPKTDPPVTTTKEINTRVPVVTAIDFLNFTNHADDTIFDSNGSNYYIKKATINNKSKDIEIQMSYDRTQVTVHCTFEIEFDVDIEWYNDELNDTYMTSTHVVFYS